MRYTWRVARQISTSEYQALAELRFRIRKFLHEGDLVARTAGLKPQQYLLLLAVRGLPDGAEASVRTVAGRLGLKHHSTVELIDRLEARGLVKRLRAQDDRRTVRVALRPRGEKLLEEVARHRISELRVSGAELVKAISTLLHKSTRRKSRSYLG